MNPIRWLLNWRDPRKYQITILSILLMYAVIWLDFILPAESIVMVIAVALVTQCWCTHWFGLPRFDPKSALISSLSLCLLLRAEHEWVLVLATMLAISSKFLIRFDDKHIYNPVNFSLVVMMLITDHAWVSPGQWGTSAFWLFLVACLGGLVVYRHARSDVTYAFFIAYCAILFGRALWLGDPLDIPLHQIQNGAFLLFTFFMISDPKTTPNHRVGRITYASVVAVVAAYIQFALFIPTALLWALFICAPLVPLIDRLMKGRRYLWPEYQLRKSS